MITIKFLDGLILRNKNPDDFMEYSDNTPVQVKDIKIGDFINTCNFYSVVAEIQHLNNINKY